MVYRYLFANTRVVVHGRPCLEGKPTFEQELDRWRTPSKLRSTKEKLTSEELFPSPFNLLGSAQNRSSSLIDIFLTSKQFNREARFMFYKECIFDLRSLNRHKNLPSSIIAPMQMVMCSPKHLTQLRQVCNSLRIVLVEHFIIHRKADSTYPDGWACLLPSVSAMLGSRRYKSLWDT